MAKYKRVTTPTGVAHYPWLKDPDTKFLKEGLYSCNIFLDMDDAKGLMKTIDKAIEDKVDFEKKETGKSKLKTCTPPYIVGGSEDDTNDIVPKGQVLFKIKSKAEINGTPVRPLVYDSKSSEPYSGGLKVFGGSKVKVAFDLRTWHVPSTGVGVTLSLVAVQVIELQERAAPSLESMCFQKEEEGFVFGDEDNSTEGTATNAKEEKESKETYDF